MMQSGRSQQGFTLIEVLVALTLMAVVSLISWQALDVVQRTQERLDDNSQQIMDVVRVLGQLESDVQQHATREVLPTRPVDPTSAQPTVPVQWLPPGIVWAQGDGLMLVRAAGDGRWQRVRWFLRGDRLMRATGLASDTLPLPDVQSEYEVLKGVGAFSMRVWLPGRGWSPLPEGDEQAGAAVRAVELRVVPTGASEAQAYRKVVMLP